MPDKAMQELCRVVAALRHPREVADFLRALLTPAERARIILRWRLVCLLEAGMKQRAIADKLGISLCKITRGSRELKHGPPCFRDHVRKSNQQGKEGPP